MSLWVNCSAIISLLIASLGRHESKESPRVTQLATLTHWPAFGRHSHPLPLLLHPHLHIALLLLSLPINLWLPPHCQCFSFYPNLFSPFVSPVHRFQPPLLPNILISTFLVIFHLPCPPPSLSYSS